MKHRGARADERRGEQQQWIVGSERQEQQPEEREAHPDRE